MSGRDPVGHYLEELRAALGEQRELGARRRRRVVEEAAEHLRRAELDLIISGLEPEPAAREAVRRFGEPRLVARAWAGALRPGASWSRWAWAGALGLVAGLALALPAGAFAEALLGMMLVLPVAGAVLGGSLGVSQCLVTRRALARPWLWIGASAVGLAVGLTGGTVLVEAIGLERGRPLEEGAALLLIGAATGAGLGLAQWPALRRRHRQESGAGWWIASSAAGMAVGLLVGGTLAALAGGPGSPAGFFALAACAGLVSGGVSGCAFHRLSAEWGLRGVAE